MQKTPKKAMLENNFFHALNDFFALLLQYNHPWWCSLAVSGHNSNLTRSSNSSMKALVRRVNKITKTIETKSGVIAFADGLELGHNRIVTYSNGLIATVNGVTDEENAQGRRIGDKITLSNVN